jgi:hypothetical protein
MPNESPEIAEFLNGLADPLKDAIIDARAAILASDEQISEHVKWNASFCYQGDDRFTFRLQPGDRLQHDLADAKEKPSAVVDLVGRGMRATA